MMKTTILLTGLLFFLFSGQFVHAESATVSWDPNSENDLAGYKIYYGVNSHNYDNIVDVGNVTSFTITDLNKDVTYYFAVTAYDFSNNESGFSKEVSAMIGGDTNPPDLVDIFVNGDTQIDVVFSEPLEKTSAETISNYTINNGVRVLGAVLDESNLTTVSLVTSPHERGTSYVLIVNNVSDLEGNAVAAGTSRSYDIPQSTDDNSPPELTGVEIIDPSHLNVIFNESVEQVSAETVGNYNIDNGIQVVQAQLQGNPSVVQLTTTQHQNNVTYTLTVTGVTDRAAFRNTIAGNNSYSYQINSGDSTDTQPPKLISVAVRGATQIDLNFSEPLEQTSAEDKSHYSIIPDIVVKGAVLNTNLTTVHLVTSPHQDGKSYTVIVNNINDRAETPNTIERNSSFEYTFNSNGEFPDNRGNNNPQFQPRSFALFQNYPNPFNPETEIRFFLEKDRKVQLHVYNALGQRIKTVVNDVLGSGYHTVIWDGTNFDGMKVPSGIYFYSLEIKREILNNNQLVNVSLERRVKRMTLIR